MTLAALLVFAIAFFPLVLLLYQMQSWRARRAVKTLRERLEWARALPLDDARRAALAAIGEAEFWEAEAQAPGALLPAALTENLRDIFRRHRRLRNRINDFSLEMSRCGVNEPDARYLTVGSEGGHVHRLVVERGSDVILAVRGSGADLKIEGDTPSVLHWILETDVMARWQNELHPIARFFRRWRVARSS